MSAECVRYSEGCWRVGGVAVADLAERYGTPLFVYDDAVLSAQFDTLRRSLPDNVAIYYSIKANPNPEIVKFFAKRAAGLEVASAGEFVTALAAGVSPKDVLFAGPGKTAEELAYVCEAGLGELHVESMEELEAVEALGLPIDVCLRFNPAASASGGAMRMGGKPSPFGFDEEELPDLVKRVIDSDRLRYSGLHMFAGTQVLDADVLLSQWRHALEVALSITDATGHPPKTVDLGGGLGVPYFAGEKSLDMEAVAVGATALFGDAAREPRFADTRFILEPGRFLSGPAGVYVARVVSVKHSRGTRFIVLDGGMHHHLAASGNLGQVIKKDYPLLNLSQPETAPTDPAVVVGPLCTPLDTLGRRAEMPDTMPGDLVGVLQSGAYGLTASPVGFLSHRLPAEVVVRGEEASVAAERGTYERPWRR